MSRLPQDERRRQLVDAAIRVMTRDGVARATTRAIAAEAGVSLSVFHYCFASKQELLEAVIEEIVSHTVTRAMATVEAGATPRDTVQNALRAYWSHVQGNPEEHQLTYEVTQFALRQPDFAAVARAQYEHYVSANIDFFDHLHRTLGIESRWPVPTLARYLAVVVDGLTLHWLVLRDDDGAENVLAGVVEQVTALLSLPTDADS